MAYWKNLAGDVFDDMDGGALFLPSWPQGLTLCEAPPLTEEESDVTAAALARGKRDRLLRDVYDPAVAMLQRASRLDPSKHEQYAAKLSEFDTWAVALQAVPEQAGFPQDIDWPVQPTAEAL